MCSPSPALCENQLVLAYLRSDCAVVWISFLRIFWSTSLLAKFLILLPFVQNRCREWLSNNQGGRAKFSGVHPCPQSATPAALWTGIPCTGESAHVSKKSPNYCNSLIAVVHFHYSHLFKDLCLILSNQCFNFALWEEHGFILQWNELMMPMSSIAISQVSCKWTPDTFLLWEDSYCDKLELHLGRS